MIKYCLEKWDANKEKLREALSGMNLEAIVLEWAVQEYIDSREKMLKERGEL